MHVDPAENCVVCKICYCGPALAGKGLMIEALYRSFAANDGEHTTYEHIRIAPRDELLADRSEAEADATIAATEAAFGAPYKHLLDAGAFVGFRTRLPPSSGTDVDIYARAVTVTEGGFYGAIRAFALSSADAVVFVADTTDDRWNATMEAWENLQHDQWTGPIVLVVNGHRDADDVAKELEHTGPTFQADDGFHVVLEAFATAARRALDAARARN